MTPSPDCHWIVSRKHPTDPTHDVMTCVPSEEAVYTAGLQPDAAVDLAALVICVVGAFVAGFTFGWLERGRHG